MIVYGSCAARIGPDAGAVLFLGPSGTGKSDLVLRLIDRGWRLVADDQVALRPTPEGLLAEGPAPLRGLLEVRGLGIFSDLPVAGPVPLRLAIELVPRAGVPRLPHPAAWEAAGHRLPRLALHAFDGSAPEKVAWALAAATGRAAQRAGAFAA